MTYVPPTILRQWEVEDQHGEHYSLMVFEGGTIGSACGRYAQGSGYRSCTWGEFLNGDLDALVRDTMGEAVLSEARRFVASLKPAA